MGDEVAAREAGSANSIGRRRPPARVSASPLFPPQRMELRMAASMIAVTCYTESWMRFLQRCDAKGMDRRESDTANRFALGPLMCSAAPFLFLKILRRLSRAFPRWLDGANPSSSGDDTPCPVSCSL